MYFSQQACQFLVEFCSLSSTTATLQSDLGAPPTAPLAIDGGDDGEGEREAVGSLFSFLCECVSNCTSEERDRLLPGEQQVARAILLAVHAEATTSVR